MSNDSVPGDADPRAAKFAAMANQYQEHIKNGGTMADFVPEKQKEPVKQKVKVKAAPGHTPAP